MPRGARPSSRPPISPPLPLPVHFTLLPSLLPNRALTPLLYVLINDIPVYLTLSATHAPHLSLLPLLLALLPTSPIHLIRQLPSSISSNLDGVAPWEDLWLPLNEARELCARLGVDRLFWDERGSGMLCNGVAQAVSWEEEGMICHNWIPSQAAIAASAYSLDTLLGTPFPGVEIISNDRYITTQLDSPRKARILHQEFENTSQIRNGLWAQAWPLILRWSLLAWDDYLLYPSKPSRLKATSNDARLSGPQQLLGILPSLANETLRPAYTPTLADLSSLILPPTLFSWHQLPWLMWSLLGLTFHTARTIVLYPFSRSSTRPPARLSFVELRRRELLARVSLGLTEMVGMLMVTLWSLSHELAVAKAGQEIGPTIVLQTPLRIPRTTAAPSREPVMRHLTTGETTKKDGAEDELEVLEERRGGSPPPSSSPHRSSSPKAPNPKMLDSTEQPAQDEAGEEVSSDAESEDSESPPPKAAERIMRSEDTKEWWMYYTLVGVLLVAVALGMAT